MGPQPDYLARAPFGYNLEGDLYGQDAWERAPPHVVVFDESPAVIQEALEEMSRNAGSERRRDKAERIARMKSLYADIWGKRGTAHIVVKRWREAGEDEISVRTVQAYFKETRI